MNHTTLLTYTPHYLLFQGDHYAKKILIFATCVCTSTTTFSLNTHACAAENAAIDRSDYAIISESNSIPLSIQSKDINIDGLVYSNCNIDSTINIDNQRDTVPIDYNVTNFSFQFMSDENDIKNHDDNYCYYGDVNVVNSFGISSISAADSKLLVDKLLGVNENVDITSDVVSNLSDEHNSIISASNGDISIQCNLFDFDGIVYAPNGSVTICANDVNLYGLIIAKEVKIQSNTLDIESNDEIFYMYDIEFYTLEEAPTVLNIMDAEGSSSGNTWYYNTGKTVRTEAVYYKYRLLATVKPGDIIHEKRSSSLSAITGHIACVEGLYYGYDSNNRYRCNIQIIEAISSGVCRSILDDTRCNDNNVTLLRYKNSISDKNMRNLLNFLIGQLGKKFALDGSRNTSFNTSNRYCSELVWAAYNYIGLDIEDGNFGLITPDDILDSSNTKRISYK